MTEQPSVYAPVIRQEGDRVTVLFSPDHPAYGDREYQEHRAVIARAALEHRRGDPPPHVDYTGQEHRLWHEVTEELAELHRHAACAEFRAGAAALDLPTTGVPQLADVGARLRRLTGFRFEPAAGLVAARDFYSSLGDRTFRATQYVRHSAYPRFSPEPDMLHEVVGHGNALAHPAFAALYAEFGRTVRAVRTSAAVHLASKLFWFTMEAGLVLEHGEPKVCGASVLSSCEELEQFAGMTLRPLDWSQMLGVDYLVQDPQPVLFYAESFARLEEFVVGTLARIRHEELAGAGR